jgi:16S rRNA G966 N2-methylase RsmD
MNREELKKIFGCENLKNILEKWYLNEKKSTPEIEKSFKKTYDIETTNTVIYLLLKEFNIEIRSISDSVSMAVRSMDYEKNILEEGSVEMQVIDGLLLSDGYISSSKDQKYHRFSLASSQKEFISYCRDKLLKLNPSEIMGGEHGYSNEKGYEKVMHAFSTAFHPDFTKQRVRWYIDGKKLVPKDIKLTPLSLKLWYYGDGTLINNRISNSCVVRLSTDGFTQEDVEFLIEQLKTLFGIKSKNANGRIRLLTESIPSFFNCIGMVSDIDCYSYKFDVDEWRFWKSMKLVSNSLKIPYSRLCHLVKTDSIEHSRSPGGKKVFFTDSQVKKIEQLHCSGLLETDARKSSLAVTKGAFKKEPNTENKYDEILSVGFPYITLTEAEKVIMFNRLNNIPTITIDDREIKASYRDNELAMNYHPHLFNVRCDSKRSPHEAFGERKTLTNLVEKFLSKNIEFSSLNVRNEICQSDGTKRTSVFPVRIAKTLYTVYGKDNMRVLDPCAGYSSRLIGFLTSARGGTYEGIEPCVKTYKGLIKTIDEIQPMTKNHNVTIYNDCAETKMPTINNQYDMIFTSPPYFNKEKYSDEETQSFIKYSSYDKWLDGFLFTLIRESHRLLKNDGVFLLNISNCNTYNIVEHTESFVRKLFNIEKVLLMTSKARFEDDFVEPIFILRKK